MLRFLLADDYEIMRKGLKQILLEGYPSAYIEEVADASQLLSKAIESHWDLVMTDLNMPGGGGLNALKLIRMQKKELPVLVISIHPPEQYAHHVLQAGANGYLSKYLSPDKILATVQNLLSGKQ